jgi:hypothetical protein
MTPKRMQMDIRFSRHAKRRMSLYDLKEEDILSLVTENKSEWETGERFIIIDDSMKKYELPLKVVGIRQEECIMIVTVYPLKQRSEDR